MQDAIRLTALIFIASGVLLTILGIPMGLILSRVRGRFWSLIEVIVLLPLVFPPTVLGYYLMRFIGQGGLLHRWFGLNLMFTPVAAILASTLVGLPLMIQASRAAFASVDPVFIETARVLGAGEWRILRTILIPLARRGILAGWILGVTRAIGEFGATLMVAGNIPGRTQTIPLAIYESILAGDEKTATTLVLIMTFIAIASLLAVRMIESTKVNQSARS